MAYATRESVAALSEIDPEFAEVLKDPQAIVAIQASLQAALAKQAGCSSESTEDELLMDISMRDGHQNQIRVHKPTDRSSKSPLVVLIYGGGFMNGDNTQLSPTAKMVAALYDATVVCISYRHAPTFKFPTAPNDVWDSLQWIASSAQSLGADAAAGFIIGGISAGANLAAVAAQKALDEKLSPPITGVWLNIPLLLELEILPAKYKNLYFSREQNADSFLLNKQALDGLRAAYEPDIYSPDYSPFNAKNPHKGLPPYYIQVSGQDPLRDDGLVYEKVLREHGVQTTLAVYPGVPHGHGTFPSLKSAQKSNSDTLKGIGALLKREVSEEEIAKVMATDSQMREPAA